MWKAPASSAAITLSGMAICGVRSIRQRVTTAASGNARAAQPNQNDEFRAAREKMSGVRPSFRTVSYANVVENTEATAATRRISAIVRGQKRILPLYVGGKSYLELST